MSEREEAPSPCGYDKHSPIDKVTKAEKITNVVYLRRSHRSSISSGGSVDSWCTRSPGRVWRSTKWSQQHGRRSPRGKRIKIVEGEKKKEKRFYCSYIASTHARIPWTPYGEPWSGRTILLLISSYPMILKSWQQVEVKWEKRRKQK